LASRVDEGGLDFPAFWCLVVRRFVILFASECKVLDSPSAGFLLCQRWHVVVDHCKQQYEGRANVPDQSKDNSV